MGNKPSKDFQFFLDNVKELEKKYKGKYVVIKDCKIIGDYDTFKDGVFETVKKGIKAGSFIVQKADANPETYTVHFNGLITALAR
jgi:hypothetical protein